MTPRSSILSTVITTGLLSVLAPGAQAGGVAGHAALFELIKGQPNVGHKEVYETNLFLSPASSSVVGLSRRLGTTCWNTTYNYCGQGLFLGDGCYCIDGMPLGNYSILVDQPLFFVPPKVVSNVVIPASGKLDLDVFFGLDFSTYFKSDFTVTTSNFWYQTFVATGTGIRGVAFSYAAGGPSQVTVNILEDNGESDIRQWRLIGSGTDMSVNNVTDNWVRFRYGQIRTIPERRYAVQLACAGGTIQPYKRPKDGNSYAHGAAYDAAGIQQNFDLNVTVFSDNDGTIVIMNQRAQDLAPLVDGYFAPKWGQTFLAHSTSLAGVDVFAAGANKQWDLDFTWKVFEADANGPTGPQIGPTKITKAASQSYGAGLHGVSYNPNEVPLVPGHSYFIEYAVINPPPDSQGFNPYVMNADSYDDGMGYQWIDGEWIPRPEMDASMTVLEYKLIAPAILVNPVLIPKTVYLGGGATPNSFTIKNSGNGTLNYTISESVPWLEVSSSGGSSTGESDSVTITYLTDNLPLGQYTGVITVASPDADSSPQTVTVKLNLRTVLADFDHDTDVDVSDYGHLQMCYSGNGTPQTDPACLDARLDGDDDVDQLDLQVFLNCLSGPENRADPACAGS